MPSSLTRSLALVFAGGLLSGCQTLEEVSIGYADAVVGAELPTGDGPLELQLPALVGIDPTQSPSLSRYSVTREEIETVKVGQIEVGDGSGGCRLPYSSVSIRIDGGSLGSHVFARGSAGADGCAKWVIDPTDLGPWFRQPTFTLDALVEAAGPAPTTVEFRISFLVDVKDKRID